ncbi:hypothetical protein [Arthrobacter agilis]|uniref:hypothetical protein n=1 Tax=Arthrobacter agilis TaxID=37921 RepID=UPI001ABF203C|nr:hypothetical protein [Arthrobacter agilis]
MNAALSAFLGELAVNLEEHREYDRLHSRERLASDLKPALPSASPLLVRIGVAKMDARPSEIEFLQNLATVVIPPHNLANEQVRLRLRLLPDLVADWARESGESKALAGQAVNQLSRARSESQIRAVQQQYRDQTGANTISIA